MKFFRYPNHAPGEKARVLKKEARRKEEEFTGCLLNSKLEKILKYGEATTENTFNIYTISDSKMCQWQLHNYRVVTDC